MLKSVALVWPSDEDESAPGFRDLDSRLPDPISNVRDLTGILSADPEDDMAARRQGTCRPAE